MELPVDPALYAAYLGVTAAMVVTPGPANLFSMALGARRGPAAAFAGVAGMNLANLVWFAAAGVGLGALVLAFPTVFRVLAWVGAAYVGWLGFTALLTARRGDEKAGQVPGDRGGSALRAGFLVQITNPKALLFITVVMPPFLDPQRPVVPQILLFAATGVTGDVLAMSAYGVSGAAIARRMREPQFRRAFSAFSGLLLISTAVLIARSA